MLKYLVFSATYFDNATDPVKKLSTDPAPFAFKHKTIDLLINKIKNDTS